MCNLAFSQPAGISDKVAHSLLTKTSEGQSFQMGFSQKESVAGSSDTLSIEPAGDIWLFAN